MFEEIESALVDVLESVWSELDASVPASNNEKDILDVAFVQEVKQLVSCSGLAIIVSVLVELAIRRAYSERKDVMCGSCDLWVTLHHSHRLWHSFTVLQRD